MKAMTSQQALAVSGGTNPEVRQYKNFTEQGSFLGATAGVLGGIAFAFGTCKILYAAPMAIVTASAGALGGAVVGYVAGAAAYKVNIFTASVVDYLFMPAE